MESSFLSVEELSAAGLGSVGRNVLIDRTAVLLRPGHIEVGSNVRIDAYCVLIAADAGIRIGSHVHLACGASIGGSEAVVIEDFCGVARNVAIFSASDDYSGGALTNPTVPEEFRHVVRGPVTLRKHAIIGANSVIMPRVTIGVAAAVGALSFVNKSVPDFAVVTGNPLRKIGMRDRSVLEREAAFLRGRSLAK